MGKHKKKVGRYDNPEGLTVNEQLAQEAIDATKRAMPAIKQILSKGNKTGLRAD